MTRVVKNQDTGRNQWCDDGKPNIVGALEELRRHCPCGTPLLSEAANAFRALQARAPLERRLMTREDLTDIISDALGDSMDVDWNYSTGARYVIDALVKEGVITVADTDLLEALSVIAKASERSETMFGGKMSEVTRVFENITRVSRAAIAKAEAA